MPSRALVLSLDPTLSGGVISMQKVVLDAMDRLGLSAHLAYARAGRLERIDPRVRHGTAHGHPTISTGYLPSIEYLNYALPALMMRRELKDFPIIHLVSGFHSASLLPLIARRPFVSWVATPFLDEIESRAAAADPTASVRINHWLRQVNVALERASYRWPRRIFSLSDYTTRRLVEQCGVPPERVEVLRFPVDAKRFTPEGAPWPRAPGRYVISVGRVDDERKNVASLVRCFARVAPMQPELHLVLVGQVHPDGAVVRQVREAGLADRVHFPGPLGGDELAAAYRGAEAYVMTSRQEGLGIVVLEAQASGAPPLLMRCGGSDELVVEGETGWLVDQGEEDTFTQRLGEVMASAELRRRVGAQARAGVLRDASMEQFTRQLEHAYAELAPGLFRRESARGKPVPA